MADHEQTTDEIRATFAAAYDIERELLGGGMSRVFLATERALNRKVVIKVLPPDLAAGVNRERFRREVQLAAQLQHPHIVPLYAAGAQGEILFYTMPFIEGESLKHALQERTHFSPREVVRILHDVVDALGYAHERGVIHRDIKPGNVLRSGAHAVVTDFGVAKAISAAMPAVGMTTSGMAIGTPAYMAPEQLAGDPAADARVDLYAVGLLAYELLSGEMPFAGTSPQETLAAQLTRTPEPLDKVRRDVPPALSAVIMRCLAKRPEDRPQSATELLATLDAIQLGSGEFAPATSRRGALGVLAAAAVVLGAIAVWQQAASRTEPRPAGRDTVTISPAGPLLTRAESLAIAKAVEARISEQRTAARRVTDSLAARSGSATRSAAAPVALTSADLKKMADSIRDEIQRTVFDSLARQQQAAQGTPDRGRGGRGVSGGQGIDRNGAGSRVFVQRGNTPGTTNIAGLAPELDSLMRIFDQTQRTMRVGPLDPIQFARRAATMGPPRHVAVTEPRITSRQLEGAIGVGATLADSVRKAIGASRRFLIVNPDSVRSALLKTRTIDDVGKMVGADMFASLSVFRAGQDSVRWQLTLRDLTAHGAYGLRAWVSDPAPIQSPVRGLDSLLAHTTRELVEMDKAPRKPPPDDAPGGPLAQEAFEARRATMGPPRRLIVWTHPPDRGHPDVEAAGNTVSDILRKYFSGNSRYVVVPTDETLNVLAKSRQREIVAQATRADLMVTLRGMWQRGDSVTWTVTAWDGSAHPTYEQRTVSVGRAALANPAVNADSLYRATARALEQLDRAPRRAPE